jgi:NADPH:quinone reductase-like Zn-dependent oxidoreductase
MKTIVYERFGPPEVLRLDEVETPTPKEREILIRVRAAVVSATDSAFRAGRPLLARLAAGARKPRLPTLGDALAGDVVAAGGAVTRFRTGDRVFGASGPRLGAHAEYIALGEDAAIAKLPDGISYAEAAGIADGGLTALPFLRDKAGVRAGQKVLVNGAAGAIGTIAVQLAKHYGAHVTGVAGAANAELVRSLGADEVIDYAREDFTLRREAFDIVFDAVGKSSFAEARRALRRGGLYLTTVPTPRAMAGMLWPSVLGGKRAIFAATGLRKPADKANDLAFMAGLIEGGMLKVVIDESFPFEAFAAAHSRVDTGHKKGVVVLAMEGAAA